MRHLWSLLAGVVAAPLAWLFLSTGQYRAQQLVSGWDDTGRFDTASLIGPVMFLAVVGILLGLLGTLRWSPAGPVAAGVLFVIPTILMFANPFDTLERFLRPDDGSHRRFLWQDLEPWLPVENGTLLVLGGLLLMAVFSLQRWRQWPTAPAPIPPATDREVVTGISTLADQPAGELPIGDPPTGTQSGGEQSAGKQSGAPAPMTDEEILAAAAAFEAAETTPGSERPATAPEPPAETRPEDERR